MTILPDWASWIAHFAIFFILCRWCGLYWWAALALTFGIEVWECSDWTKLDFAYWFGKFDTWADLVFGWIGTIIGAHYADNNRPANPLSTR